jgi:hypothetical protein
MDALLGCCKKKAEYDMFILYSYDLNMMATKGFNHDHKLAFFFVVCCPLQQVLIK